MTITTTETRARRVQPLAERLISKAKRGDLHNRRIVRQTITNPDVLHKLFAEIANQAMEGREGGYTRITKIDSAQGRQRSDGGHRTDHHSGGGQEGCSRRRGHSLLPSTMPRLPSRPRPPIWSRPRRLLQTRSRLRLMPRSSPTAPMRLRPRLLTTRPA